MLDIETVSTRIHTYQRYDFDCGPISVEMIEKRLGKSPSDSDKLLKELCTSDSVGTDHRCISKGLKDRKIGFKENYNLTIEQISQNLTVGSIYIVCYQDVSDGDKMVTPNLATWNENDVSLANLDNPDSGHYSILWGLLGNNLLVLDPGINYSINGLEKGWRVLPKILFDSRHFDREVDGTLVDHWGIQIFV